MELSEELELPPWEKFRLYGKFPWKLCLHVALVALVTALIVTTNLSYAAYSRSVWLTIANVLYPPDYARFQSDLSSPFEYYIYTQNQTIFDGNRLFLQYFSLANQSVNEVNIYSPEENLYDIPPPYVVIHSTSGIETFTIENPVNSSWPLAYHSLSTTNLRQFFNNFKKMDFHFYFRSNSNGAGYSIDSSACFFWHWHISYSSYGAGQILVDADAFIQSSCQQLSRHSNTFLMATLVFIFSLGYQLLLLKAIIRQIIVISQLSDPLFWVRWQQKFGSHDVDNAEVDTVVGNNIPPVDVDASSQSKTKSAVSKESEDLVFKYGGQQSGRNSRFQSTSSSNRSAAQSQRKLSDDNIDASIEEEKDISGDRNSSQASIRSINQHLSTVSNNTTSTARSTISFAVDITPGTHIPVEDPISEVSHTHSQPLLLANQDKVFDQVPISAVSSSHSHLHQQEMSRSYRSSFGDSNLARQSRLITLATIEADLRLLTDAFEGLTWRDRLMIFNLWFLVSTIGNLFGLIYSSRIIFFQDDVMASAFLKASLGMACLMYWFALIQYLEFFPRYYIMISMLKLSVPRVSQFLLGVLPIFFGYALLGLICFGDVTDRFGNVTETLRTLFAVVNGDIIYDTFDAIEFSGLGGQLYLYVYVLVFTYVVLMTIIAIVEEAFFEAQEKKGLGPYEYQQQDGDPPHPAINVGEGNVNPQSATITRDSLISVNSSSTRNSLAYQPPNIPVDQLADASNGDGAVTNPLNNQHSTLRRQTSLRPTEDANASSAPTSGKRELPENVRFLLRNAQRMPSLTGQAMAMNNNNNQVDILSAAYHSGFGGTTASSASIGSSIQAPATGTTGAISTVIASSSTTVSTPNNINSGKIDRK